MYAQEIQQLLNDFYWVDEVNYYHSLRVGYLMSRFTETPSGKLFLKQAWVTRNECVAAGLLHDVAKIRWPRDVLADKRLQDLDRESLFEAWRYIIEHPLASADIVMGFFKQTGNRFWERIAKGVVAHHENYLGDGFPYRLKGTEIPLLARGLRLFDNYTANTEVNRQFQKKNEPEAVIKEMRIALSGRYDPYWGGIILDFLEKAPLPYPDLDEWLKLEMKNFG